MKPRRAAKGKDHMALPQRSEVGYVQCRKILGWNLEKRQVGFCERAHEICADGFQERLREDAANAARFGRDDADANLLRLCHDVGVGHDVSIGRYDDARAHTVLPVEHIRPLASPSRVELRHEHLNDAGDTSAPWFRRLCSVRREHRSAPPPVRTRVRRSRPLPPAPSGSGHSSCASWSAS